MCDLFTYACELLCMRADVYAHADAHMHVASACEYSRVIAVPCVCLACEPLRMCLCANVRM